MNDPGNTWSDERVELLKRLWAEGLSASQIAASMGGVTRNAVIGKVHRLGLSGRAKAAASPAAKPRKAPPPRPAPTVLRSPAPVVRGNTALAQAIEPDIEPFITEAPVVAPVDVVVPISERVTIMELRESMCRWPLGDPTSADFRFCGSRTVTGLPYCAHHCSIAYQPPDRRRDRRSN